MKKILYIDLDGVVADFDGEIRRLYPEIDLLRPDLKDKRIDEILENQHHIFEHLKPLPEAVHSVTILMEYYDVYFLSTAPWIAEYSGSDKRIWVEKMFGDLAKKKLILTHRKDLCIGDYLIDDRLKNGAGEFTGELLHFGPGNDFPHWEKVIDYLRPLALEEMEQMELGGPVSKDEKNESSITKTQIENVIQGKSKVSHGTAIQAIASYLRGSQGANSKDSRPKDYKIQEENRLRKYASDKRLYMDVDTEQKPIDKGEKAKKNEEKPKEMSNVKELIEKVRIAAEKELEHCNGVDTPAVCQLINDAKGKNMVLDQICEYVGKNGMTIGEAINYIERTNNPELSNY